MLCAAASTPVRVFLDLRSAYDSVDLSLLFAKLADRGLHLRFRALLSSLFVGTVSRVVVNRLLTAPIDRHRGVFQGSPMAPLLFNIFVDDLARALDARAAPYPDALLFADDIVLHPDGPAHCQHLLDIVHTWCVANRMTINVSKCAALFASRAPPFPISYAGDPIPVVLSYPYLGVPFGPDGPDWHAFAVHSGSRAAGVLAHALRVGLLASPDTRLIIFKVFIRASLEYAGALFWLAASAHGPSLARARAIFANIHKLAVSWIFGHNPPASDVLSAVGLGSVSDADPFPILVADRVGDHLSGLGSMPRRLDELVARLHHHLVRMHPDNPLQDPFLSARLCDPVKESPIVRRFLAALRDTPSLQLDAWLLDDRLTAFVTGPATRLAAYVLPAARLRPSLRDHTFTIRQPVLRRQALLWRRNRLFAWHRCPCGHPFTRRHVHDCGLLDPFIDARLARFLARHRRRLAEQFPLLDPTCYTVIDVVVNIGDWALLADMIDHMHAVLT